MQVGFYLGDPVVMLHLYPDGSSKTIALGPGFDGADCDLGLRQALIEQYPDQHEIIIRLTQQQGC